MNRLWQPCATMIMAAAVGVWGVACGSGHEPGGTTAASAAHDEIADTEGEAETGTGGHSDEDAFEELEFESTEHDEGPEELRKAEAALLQKLVPRRRDLDEHELQAAKRSKELDAITAALDARLASIDSLEKRLQERLGVGEAARQRRDERIARLADLVSTMRPQAGANMLANMADADAQGIVLAISRDNDRKAAKILSLMPAERAAQLGQLYLDVQAPPAGSEDLGPTVDAQGPPPTATPERDNALSDAAAAEPEATPRAGAETGHGASEAHP